MDHPQTYLLKMIVDYKNNGFESLGQLDARHIKDISAIMRKYSEESMLELIKRLNKGEDVQINNDVILTLKRKKK